MKKNSIKEIAAYVIAGILAAGLFMLFSKSTQTTVLTGYLGGEAVSFTVRDPSKGFSFIFVGDPQIGVRPTPHLSMCHIFV